MNLIHSRELYASRNSRSLVSLIQITSVTRLAPSTTNWFQHTRRLPGCGNRGQIPPTPYKLRRYWSGRPDAAWAGSGARFP